MRANSDIQFAPIEPPKQEPPPEWLGKVMEWLEWLFTPLMELGKMIGVSAQAITWIAIGIVVLLVGLLLWRLLAPLTVRPPKDDAEEPAWVPDSAAASLLLEDADRLAAEGRYDEATHLLLRRSVSQIREARPDLLEPSSTAREIAVLPVLSEAARTGFGVIADRVERSLFALRTLSQDDWLAARDAYSAFALAAPAAHS
ncbi:hypothetical protein GRI97_02705 [Altererythrobacter xixiisoli]|uniref:DUF4129 domain-containing protein n=1 Tax=Croceibacterium xixiisoli TaxID=1476466 RepID=A0A6I4TRG4_9SPHN|nr:hypothetical protein [Croceibacterium xixiisoli]MXO97899.1 hypothetical protein [Croceibacterium xixiisoli]